MSKQQTLDYMQASEKALSQAQKMASDILAEQTKVAAAVPTYVDALVRSGLITAADKEAAAEQLSDPVRVLSVVGNLIEMNIEQRQKLAAAGMGEPDTKQQQKVASDGPRHSTTLAIDGPRDWSQSGPADEGFRRMCGLN